MLTKMEMFIEKVTKIEFREFALYMDILVNGTQNEKSELSFRLIDQGVKGFFNYNDFCLLIDSILAVWNSLTGMSMSKF